MDCFSCTHEEKYLIYTTDTFKIVLDDTCQLFPGKYLIVSKNHLHPNFVYSDLTLYREIQAIKIQMEYTIRRAFGKGTTYQREIRFNYCKLGNSFKEPQNEHYHEYCVPVSPSQLKVAIKGYEYIFEYHIFGKPFDNTIRSKTPPIILEWILSQLKENLVDLDQTRAIESSLKKNDTLFSSGPTSLFLCDLNLSSIIDNCRSCMPIIYETAPLFESRFFKVVLNDMNQWCFGRLHVVSKYHLDIDNIKYYPEIVDEYWLLLQLINKLIHEFYDDKDGQTTRIHVCELNNMTGQIGNSHAHYHIIPRTSKTINMGEFILKDEFWGQSFNNNIRYIPSNDLLNTIRLKYLTLLKSLTSAENIKTWLLNYDVTKINTFNIVDIFNPIKI